MLVYTDNLRPALPARFILRGTFALPPAHPPNPLAVALAAGAVLVSIGALCGLFDKPPARPGSRRNTDPVLMADKEYVSARDRWRCTYCARRVTRKNRHIDHSVSRVNGGTNHLNNLRLACAACNLLKGGLNSRQFVRTLY